MNKVVVSDTCPCGAVFRHERTFRHRPPTRALHPEWLVAHELCRLARLLPGGKP